MKKTIIALLALGGVAAAADVTIGSYYSKDGVNYDAVSNFAGKTETEIVEASGLAAEKIDNLAFSDSKSVVLDTTSMLVSDQTLASGTQLTLTGFSFIGRTDSKHEAKDSTVSIIIDGTTYTSSVASHNGYDDGNDYGLVTYTFTGENCPTFELGDSLTFNIAYAAPADVTGNAIDPYKIPMGAFQGLSGTTAVYGAWQGAFQIKAAVASASVPEPTTATLSLLALAGLAARRRRK